MNPTIFIVLAAVVASATAIVPGLLGGPRGILGRLGLGLGFRRARGPDTRYVSGFGTPVGPIGGLGWKGGLIAAAPVVQNIAAIDAGVLGGGLNIVDDGLVAAGPIGIDARALGGLGWGSEVVAAGPVGNTIAAINSGIISSGNTAGIILSNSIANANAASINDANALSRQINQQSQQDRDAALQGAIDQAVQINQLNAVSQAQAVNQASQTAQRSANQAALHQAAANQDIAAQLNAINGGAARDAAIHQANAIGQVAAVNANAAQASILNQGGLSVSGGGHGHGGVVNHLG